MQKKPHLRKLREDGLPPYVRYLDTMFDKVVASGESAYVPGHSRDPADVQQVDSDDDTGGQATLTPPSVGTKRASSTDTTAGTPPKKARGAAMAELQGTLRTLTELTIRRTDLIEKGKEEKATARRLNLENKKQFFAGQSEKVDKVLAAAIDAGLKPNDGEVWYKGVMEIIENDTWMTAFLATPDDNKRECAQFYADKVAERVNN